MNQLAMDVSGFVGPPQTGGSSAALKRLSILLMSFTTSSFMKYRTTLMGAKKPILVSPLDAAVYAWVLRFTALQFVDGGLSTNGDKPYVLEIHYSNGGQYGDVGDRSGIRVYHEPPGTAEIDRLTTGSEGLKIPAESITEVEGDHPITAPLMVIAAMPHMHELGPGIGTETLRVDGLTEDMITLSGWDFHTPLFYDRHRLQLNSGDRLRARRGSKLRLGDPSLRAQHGRRNAL